MMVKNFFILISISLALLINHVSAAILQPDTTLITDSLPEAIANGLMIEDDSVSFSLSNYAPSPTNSILDMLDSLVALKFFTNTTFSNDTNELNIYNFPSETIPAYSDSVVQARIKELNRNSPIELTYNQGVKDFINVYAVKKRALTSRILGMSELYFPLFEEYLDKYDMPLELKYLAVVESALNPTANSRAGAKGLWQFMYRTGKLYGLKETSLVDDRFDPYKATDAACRHLKDLYRLYGNWSLALAAYNSGAGNVNKAIRRAGGIKSYWAILPYLPRETRGYVPAFIAVIYLMNYPAEYNLYPIKPTILFEEIDTVLVKDALSFDQLNEVLGIPMDDLKFLNPTFKTDIIPATKETNYVLRLPQKNIPDFIDHEKDIYAYKTKNGIEKEKLLAEIEKAKERNIHEVRNGESLGAIANKYHCSVGNLKSWNNLSGTMIHPGQKLVVYAPGYTGKKSTTVSVSKPNSIKEPTDKNAKIHVVKDGENIEMIAKRYNHSVDDLVKWNDLKDHSIYVNQKLTLQNPGTEKTEVEVANVERNKTEYIYHVVRKGDTLWDIARLYDGVSIEQIKELNHITNSNRLKPGQKLKVGVKG